MTRRHNVGEAARWFTEPEPPRAEELREQVIDTVLWAETEDGDPEPLVRGLVAAYHGAVRLESQLHDRQEVMLDCARAEELMRRVFVRAVLDSTPFYNVADATEAFDWPDALRWENGAPGIEYEWRLVATIGRALGYLHAQRARACRAHYDNGSAYRSLAMAPDEED